MTRITRFLFLATAPLALPVLLAASDPDAVAPSAGVLRAVAHHFPDLLPSRVATRDDFLGSARFQRPLTVGEVSELEKLGVRFDRDLAAHHGSPARVGTIYPVRIPWSALDELGRHPLVQQIEAEPMVQQRCPLNVTRSLVSVPQVSEQISVFMDQRPGEGIRIGDNDSGIDPFHPAFFHADGGYFRWIDVNQDGALTFGTDACDLNMDGAPGPDEVLRYHDVSLVDMEKVLEGWEAFDPDGKFEVGVDWVYADTNGNGVRDFGPEAGFTDASPGFGEPILLVDDVDGDLVVDPDEKLVLLKTSKIAKVLVKGKTEYVRGKNLTQLDPGVFPSDGTLPGAAHGTGVAGILVANSPGLSKYVGMAPYADLYMLDHSLDGSDPFGFASSHLSKLVWARDQSLQVLLFEFGQWGLEFMDGSSNLETAMDQISAQNNMLMVVPAGNLGGSGKHMVAQLAPGAAKVGVDVPEWWPDIDYMPFETPYIMVSFYWYGKEGDVALALTAPGGSSPVAIPAESYDPIGLPSNLSVVSQTMKSSSGLNLRILFIVDNSQKAVKYGAYAFKVTNQSGKPLTLHGFCNDALSGWARVTTFTTFESDDSTVCHPATANSALAVAAFGGEFGKPEELGKIRPYSGRGPRIDGQVCIDIAAPDDPLSPLPEWHTGMFMGKKDLVASYMIFGGTSGAGPHVAGAAALLRQLKPNLAAQDIAVAIANGATTSPDMGTLPNKSWGHGKLNTYKAAFGVDAPPNLLPDAKLRVEHIDEFAVTVTAAGSADPEAGPLEYRFDFDYDGTWDTGWQSSPATSYTYPSQPGVVVAKVAVRDEGGSVDTALASATLPAQYDGPPEPPADVVEGDASLPDGDDHFLVDGETGGGSGGGAGCAAAAGPSPAPVLAMLLLASLCLVRVRSRSSR